MIFLLDSPKSLILCGFRRLEKYEFFGYTLYYTNFFDENYCFLHDTIPSTAILRWSARLHRPQTALRSDKERLKAPQTPQGAFFSVRCFVSPIFIMYCYSLSVC